MIKSDTIFCNTEIEINSQLRRRKLLFKIHQRIQKSNIIINLLSF